MRPLVNFLARLPWSWPIVGRCASERWRLPRRIPESPGVSFANPIDKHVAALLAMPGCPVCNNVAERKLR
jgi:hypothetical protein